MLRKKGCVCIIILFIQINLLVYAFRYWRGSSKTSGQDSSKSLSKHHNERSRVVNPSNKKQASVTYEEAYIEVMRLQNESMFFIQKQARMPLLRLDETERNQSYRAQVGKQWMRGKTAVFVALVRNARKRLQASIEELHKLGKLFKDYWMIFLENDSTDDTRELLYNELQRYKKTVILGCEPINSKAPCKLTIKYRSGKIHRPGWGQHREEEERIDRGIVMSALRNIYLDYIYDNLAQEADLMIATDPDLLWQSWRIDNIAQGVYYFAAKPKLDILCANSRFRSSLYDPCARSYFGKKRFTSVTERDRSIITDDIAIDHNKIPVKVESCYQGFAVYRISSLAKDRLHYYPVPGERSCEHNTLARRLKEIYIDPEMKLVIQAQYPHT